ncbi:MAG: methionine--tRNA ligase [Candidatus Colwellbacteria bacterium]|nr:methionine--tRNA ligase [Candidatus Colwellbacteria bacterium]
MISYSDFQNIDLRVGKIVSAERIEGSEKLLKLKVNLGDELGERQIIAGIGKVYESETLVGRNIVVVVNLEHRSLMGLESQGMLLAADDESGPVLLTPEKVSNPGSKIK